jgi:urease accessory protein
MIANLHIQTGLRNERTYLKNSFCTAPFKVADVTEDRSSKALKLMIMSSSPGVLDGDEYFIRIELAEKTSLELETQSYQRLFTMQRGASQSMEVHMREGSSFTFLPHPTVPHEASHFTGTNKIFLSRQCNLKWGEILTCGRKLKGEAFRFTQYQNTTEVFLNDRLIIKENLLIKPDSINVSAIGQLEGYTHQATLIYLNETVAIGDLITATSKLLALENQITFGISALPVNGLIVRLLGNKGEQLHDCLKVIAKHLPMKASNVSSKDNKLPKATAHAS